MDAALHSTAIIRSPKRILVVEDNATLRGLVSLALESHGYVPLCAESCEAALELAAVDPPDVWIVDHTMPGMTGADLVRCLRASADARIREAPVLGVSGRGDGASELLLAGAGRTLLKPLDERMLLAWLEGGGR